jgi:hypothetical protein
MITLGRAAAGAIFSAGFHEIAAPADRQCRI